VLSDRVRFYVTMRQLDSDKKYKGQIVYVDTDFDFQHIIGVSKHFPIALGDLGTFDEHGIFPMNVLRHEDKIYGFTSGLSRRKSVSLETSIGLAISHDNGETFVKHGTGPILSANLHEPFLVCDAFVLHENNEFLMWYIYGIKWIQNAEVNGLESRVYKIAFARSKDAISWQNSSERIISNVIGEDECQALPTVCKIGNRYHMYFCYRSAIGFRDTTGKGYRLGYAYSDDLITWTRDDQMGGLELSEDGWDSEMMCYPHLFKVQNKVFIAYNGNAFGKEGFGIAELISTE
jgi:sucrose-6-phosphate hydrolase SacC (GH32 family)